jgi:hypothetical protein
MYRRNASLDQRPISMIVNTGTLARYITMAAPDRIMEWLSAHLARLEAKVILADMTDHGPKMVQDHLGGPFLEFSFVHVGVDRCMDVGTQIGENPFGNCCPETDWAKLGAVCPVLSDYCISLVCRSSGSRTLSRSCRPNEVPDDHKVVPSCCERNEGSRCIKLWCISRRRLWSIRMNALRRTMHCHTIVHKQCLHQSHRGPYPSVTSCSRLLDVMAF